MATKLTTNRTLQDNNYNRKEVQGTELCMWRGWQRATLLIGLELNFGEWHAKAHRRCTYHGYIAKYSAKVGGGQAKTLVPVQVLPRSKQTLKLVRRYMTRISAHCWMIQHLRTHSSITIVTLIQ